MECTEEGMELEVARLQNCPDCARRQAMVLDELDRSAHAEATRHLAAALAKLKEVEATAHQARLEQLALHKSLTKLQSAASNKGGGHAVICAAQQTAIDNMLKEVEEIRAKMTSQSLWFYGCEKIWNDTAPSQSPQWPHKSVQKPYGTFKQPLCQSCDDYRLDFTTIVDHLNYVLHQPASEKMFSNQVRDKGRSGKMLADFENAPEAEDADLSREEVASLRFYTSNSFDAINTALRDHRRDTPHPLPAITMNIQKGIKKLRAVGANDASARRELVLWRGFKDMQVTEEFNETGGTELAPMSTTTDLGVAVEYATESGDTGSALIFRIVTENNLQRGAGLSVRGNNLLRIFQYRQRPRSLLIIL